jgi:hypothetical protein
VVRCVSGRGEGHRCARQTYDRQQVGWGHPGTRSIEMKGKNMKKEKIIQANE